MATQKTGLPAWRTLPFMSAMALNSGALIVISTLAQKLLNEFATVVTLGVAAGSFDFAQSALDVLAYLSLAILPALAVILLALFAWMRPFARAVRKIKASGHVSAEEFKAAMGRLIGLPWIVMAFNLCAFILAYFVGTDGGLRNSSRGVPLFLQYFSGAIVCGYVQIVINNLVLASPRSLLQISNMGKYREMTEGQRSLLMSLALSFYTMFSVIGASQAIEAGHLLRAGTEFKAVNPLIVYLPILLFLVGLTIFIQMATDRYRRAQFAFLEDKLRSLISGKADLTQRLVIGQFDELGELVNTINLFIEKLKNLFGQFMEAGVEVAESSETLREVLVKTMATTEMMVESIEATSGQASAQFGIVSETEATLGNALSSLKRISEAVDSQASAVEQTSAAVSEMAANIKAVSRATERANEFAASLTKVAASGGIAVGNAARAIGEVSAASARVDSIVGTISKIAAQTNLLAMNAAIEAAHAGSAGAGFAVVAGEVRSLAESSARSAKDIATNIKGMRRLIGEDVKLAAEASEALDRIGRDVEGTGALIDQIAAGMKEQEVGANEIVDAMSSLVEASQSIRATAEIQRIDSEAMRASIARLVEIFGNIHDATSRQAEGNRYIIEGMKNLQEVATRNQAIVGHLEGLLRGFVLKGGDQSVVE
ncbi:MAG: methyl-accepting chemotaxis protein [Spirochaetota bacterium]